MVTKKTKRPKTVSGRTEIFQKQIVITLTGSDKKDLQAVAHKIHSLNDPLVLVGKNGRKVHMTHESTEPTVVFRGQVKVTRGKIPSKKMV